MLSQIQCKLALFMTESIAKNILYNEIWASFCTFFVLLPLRISEKASKEYGCLSPCLALKETEFYVLPTKQYC